MDTTTSRVFKIDGKALVIDDSETARTAIGNVLSRSGWEVFELPSAIGATRTILRYEIDAVILDLSMPGLTGDKLVSVLRSNPKLRGLVVIIVSGRPPRELAMVRERVAADAVLSKDEVSSVLMPTLYRTRMLRRSAL